MMAPSIGFSRERSNGLSIEPLIGLSSAIERVVDRAVFRVACLTQAMGRGRLGALCRSLHPAHV